MINSIDLLVRLTFFFTKGEKIVETGKQKCQTKLVRAVNKYANFNMFLAGSGTKMYFNRNDI